MTAPAKTSKAKLPKADGACVDAVDLARRAAEEAAGDWGPQHGNSAGVPELVGAHLGYLVEGERIVSHHFACTDPGYQGWHWSVTVVRASRAKNVTINEVVMLPGADALRPPVWIPWSERVGAGDIAPGVVMPTPDDDVRLEPGYTGGESAADLDPAEASQTRAVVAELGLGRERVLSLEGRDDAAQRWLRSEGGPNNEMTELAPAQCVSCGYFVRLSGRLGTLFGACANEFSPTDGRVVSIDHGCGGHSDVVEEKRRDATNRPVWDSMSWDGEEALFD